uniref:Cytochrome c oxidase subunit 3 n=1 Tax=Stygobromus foliatus TaxID=1678291 RepID=A0A172QHE5_9CRUS|nr:cytochrome c oxidase subunit III [Stygobromus foliatus]
MLNNIPSHPFHLVQASPWPLAASMSGLMMTSGLVVWFNLLTPVLLIIGVASTVLSSLLWWRDITREGTLQGDHTLKVISGLRFGMLLFIVSEVMFFFSFFWAFFHSSLAPTFNLGAQWAPVEIHPFNAFQIPFLNTVILLASGVTVTWAHHAVLEKSHDQAIQGLFMTIMLGGYFTMVQAMEYKEASFTMADSVFGSTFFVATGFHGLHVIIGTTMLLVSFNRIYKGHISSSHHFGLEASIWYWHFVDVVWLFLFTSIYWWGA